jgi:hypothetical protein
MREQEGENENEKKCLIGQIEKFFMNEKYEDPEERVGEQKDDDDKGIGVTT